MWFEENLSDHKGHLLPTCTDCLLWTDTFRNGDVTGRFIMQFSKSHSLPSLVLNLSIALKFKQLLKYRQNVFCASARTGAIDATGVELFKKQVTCLNFPESFHSYDSKTGQ